MKATTILIIDDEKAVRKSLAAYLDDCGYRTLTAGNGREGMQIFEREQVDLVLVDLRMPEVDGLEVLARVRGASPRTPTIVVSGTGVIEDVVDALHQGAWDFVLKPIEDFSVLAHAVGSSLERARLLRENREYQQHLEYMVAERTAALEQANANLFQINERLRRVVESTRALAFCTDVAQFGRLLLEEFAQHMLAAGGSLYMAEKEGLRLVHSLDPGHAVDFIPFPLHPGSVFQRVLNDKQPVLIRDISQQSDLSQSGWRGYGDDSALVFPLPDESGKIAGVLSLHSKGSPPFVDQDREIGMILASYSREALRTVRANENLRENERRFRDILDTIQTGITVVDADSFAILYANPAAARMFGAPIETILGRDSHDVLGPSEGDRCLIGQLGREMESAERVLRTLDGRDVPVLKSVSRTVLQGRECYLESFTDLSEQKRIEDEKEQLERQLRQAQKLQALGTLAGGIAHDFNNILTAVLGYAQLGLRDLAGTGEPLYAKLDAIYHAGQRAKDLVAQILAFSRMQEKVRLPLTIGPIIKEVTKLLRSSLPPDIEVRTDIRTQRVVLADATEIHQVVMNLCTNAYHAMEECGGVLEIVLDEVHLDQVGKPPDADLLPGEYARLTISDTGCGISSVIIDRVFEPYFTTKSKTKGTGLGLAVTHGIVKDHHGAITVTSQVGQGTLFTVFFPIVDDPETTDLMVPPPLPQGSESVLLVDDESVLVEMEQEMLEDLGYRVTGIVGGPAALEVFRQSPGNFDLVITDLDMPVLSGVRLAEALTRIRPGIPILLCTGFSEGFDEEKGEDLGIRRVLMKPLTIEDLALAAREALND
jgi:PAS domain S-box-containing protein